jgi:TctA family transporter
MVTKKKNFDDFSFFTGDGFLGQNAIKSEIPKIVQTLFSGLFLIGCSIESFLQLF